MVKLTEVKDTCVRAIEEHTGLTTTSDNIVVEDFEIVGEKEDIFVSATFTLRNCGELEFYYHHLCNSLDIISRHYDAKISCESEVAL